MGRESVKMGCFEALKRQYKLLRPSIMPSNLLPLSKKLPKEG